VQRGDGNPVVAWSRNGSLYVSRPHELSADEFFVVTERGSLLQAVDPPDDVVAVFRLRWQRQPDDDRLQENGTYAVRLQHELHGIKLIQVSELNKPGVRELAVGSWELESFIFDREHSMVIYPVERRGPDTGIVLANLRTRRNQTLKLPNVRDLRLLDRHPTTNMIAYSVGDACDATSSKQEAPVHICFARW
jgi:hypothetical protein